MLTPTPDIDVGLGCFAAARHLHTWGCAEQAEVTAEINAIRDQLKPKVKELSEMGTYSSCCVYIIILHVRTQVAARARARLSGRGRPPCLCIRSIRTVLQIMYLSTDAWFCHFGTLLRLLFGFTLDRKLARALWCRGA